MTPDTHAALWVVGCIIAAFCAGAVIGMAWRDRQAREHWEARRRERPEQIGRAQW